MTLSVVSSCGYQYLHANGCVRRIDHLSDVMLPMLLRDVATELDQRTGHVCEQCGSSIVRRPNESVTNYRNRRFCCISCGNRSKASKPDGSKKRRIKRRR